MSIRLKQLLIFLRHWPDGLAKKQDRYIAYKILEKAEQLAVDEKRIIDVHFLYSEKIEIYYKYREGITCFEKAIEACYQQISIAESAAQAFRSEYKELSLPAHKWYEQLSIILEKKLKYQEVINLCCRAQNKSGPEIGKKGLNAVKVNAPPAESRWLRLTAKAGVVSFADSLRLHRQL